MNEIEQLLADCEKRERRLNEWEKEFITDMRHRFAAGRALSDNMRDRLNAIWEKATERG